MANTVGIRGNPFRRARRALRILAIAVFEIGVPIEFSTFSGSSAQKAITPG